MTLSTNDQNVKFNELEAFRWNQYIQYKDAGLTDFKIALKWHLTTTRQLTRLKNKAKQNGAYKEWMDSKLSWISEKFPEVYAIVEKEDPKLACLIMARLFAKAIPQRVEMESREEITETITHKHIQQLDLSKLTKNERKAILDAEEALTRAENQNSQE